MRKLARPRSQHQLIPAFQRRLDAAHELIRHCAVEHPVVKRKRQVNHGANGVFFVRPAGRSKDAILAGWSGFSRLKTPGETLTVSGRGSG